ncbi:hypothetical protein [Ruegeria hyattellae]|uniref:hypothetical protein n=1 Tax=Ruegeria hyattellae TaxID=3233337 RepID=UPI00355C255E
MINIKLFLPLAVYLACSFGSAVHADRYAPAPPADHSQPWCGGDIHISRADTIPYPEGGIVQVGPYFFRACRSNLAAAPDGKRAIRFYYNPRRVDGLSFDKAMVGLMINGLFTWGKNFNPYAERSKSVGYKTIGNVEYELRQYSRPNDDTWIGRKFLVYTPSSAADPIPQHVVVCYKEFERHPAESMNCFLQVGYDQIWGNLLFIGGGPNLKPIPLEDFPKYAEDIYRILETADVTERVENGTIDLPRLD